MNHLKDEKEVESGSGPSNYSQHVLDAADHFQRVINDIPRIQLGGRYGNIIQERLPFRPHSISAIPMCTRV